MSASASAATTDLYTRRNPTKGVLHTVVREHLETFLAEMEQRGDERELPRFVEQQ